MNSNLIDRRKLSIIISIVLLLSTFSLTEASAVSEPKYESPGMIFMDETKAGKELYEKNKGELPSLPGGGAPPQYITGPKGTKLYVNLKLWLDHHILCYGEWSDVPDNYRTGSPVGFKNSTEKPGQPVETNKGYYLKNGKRGEYRYHGYDVSGNKMTNLYFEVDSSVTQFDERDWIKNPWIELPSSYKNKPDYESTYNNAATGKETYPDPAVQPGVRNWINKSMEQYGGVPLLGKEIDPEVFRYLYVESAPTTLGLGQGRMFHRRPDGSIWYQTIAVPKLTEKKDLPVTASITLLTADEVLDAGPAMDDNKVKLSFKVSAVLEDTAAMNDPVLKSVYYTRQDIQSWEFTFTPPADIGATQKASNVEKVDNTGSAIFEIETTYGKLRNRTLHLTATGQPLYNNDHRGYKDNAELDYNIHMKPIPQPPVQPVIIIDIPTVTIDHHIGEIAFDSVPFRDAEDHTDMTPVSGVELYVNGQFVDYQTFFSGQYVFPEVTGINGYMAEVIIRYNLNKSKISLIGLTDEQKADIMSDTPVQYVSKDYVYVYPTKPIANFQITSGTWKQNRLIKVQETSNAGNIQLVLDQYPIVDYEWTFGGDMAPLRKGVDTNLSKELLYKEPGIYSLTLKVKNTLGKWSDPYTVSYEVLEDVGPAIGVNLAESVFTRNDKVSSWYYLIASTDGDVIQSSSIELWYDSDNDGTVDRVLNSWSNQEKFPDYTPTKLGYYKYVLKAQEDIISDTLPQFITNADKKQAIYEVEFWVDNFRPMSDLYINIPIQRPAIDVYLMLDKNLDAQKVEYIKSNRVNVSNWLLEKNIIPNVNIWDMKTYTYSQPASTSVYSGGSYPSVTTIYSSNGYSGTLNRTSVTNNSYSRDEGSYQTRTETKTASAGGSSTSGHGASDSYPPSSVSYSDGEGYSGTLSAYGYNYSSWACGHKEPHPPHVVGYYYWTRSYAGYSGTVSRTASYWVPNIRWYDNYTGFYSGTIYKDVRQPYTDPFNPTSAKYVVYISDNGIAEPADLNMVMGYAKTAKLYLAGTSQIQSQRPHDKYFDVSGKTMAAVMDDILQDISANSPDVERFYMLQNEKFVLNAGQLDLENDPIIETGMQYVHEADYYDNPTGSEPGTTMKFNEASGWNTSIKSSLANVGKYTIYRRVRDYPSTDPNFTQYSYYSGNTSLEVYVVRKPIALATLDWDYNAAASTYKTAWKDLSYDPDHQYSRADKGIVDRNIMWRRTGGQWNYGIPDNLTAGTYELNYYVLDPEGYWSDPFVMNFTLSAAPPMQFDASLRTLDQKFSLIRIANDARNPGIPASEYLQAFNLWTRHPSIPTLKYALFDRNGRQANAEESIQFNDTTGIRNGNDIKWNDFSDQIPATMPDGIYQFRIWADAGNGNTAAKSFEVHVSTPLNLEPSLPYEVVGGTVVQADAHTTKYASTVTATLFQGTAYERTYTMTGKGEGTGKVWAGNLSIPENIPEGEYNARFTATAPNGNSQTRDVRFKLTNLSITHVSLSGYWNHWRGQADIFGEPLSNEPHRFLSLECVKINIDMLGNPERVTVRFSPELEAMSYTDPKGHTYSYKEDYFGYSVRFPEDSTFTGAGNHISWEYYLPLAPSTKSWNNNRQRQPYRMTVTAHKGGATAEYVIDDIEITGNIYDLTYIQPKE